MAQHSGGHALIREPPKPAKPNQTDGRRQDPSSAVRAILDDPPIHIRPVCSRKSGCEGQEPRTLWVQRFSARPWLHSSATPATRFFARLVTSQLVRDYAFSQTEPRKSGPCGAV